jgi:hypothetical protein
MPIWYLQNKDEYSGWKSNISGILEYLSQDVKFTPVMKNGFLSHVNSTYLEHKI